MYLIEVERGCNWGCRFCLVSNCYRADAVPFGGQPVKSGRNRAEIPEKRLGLMGPSVTDHPQIEELVGKLRDMGAEFVCQFIAHQTVVRRWCWGSD